MIDVQALNGIYKIEVQELGIQGMNGKNAYELAVSTGEFVGTLEEYVNLPIIAAENANQAADNANQAASDVGSAVIDAEAAALLANEKANLANLAAISANEAALLANTNANLANLAATNANNATGLTETATIAANNAAILANEKANLANLAAINANDKATLANNAVTAANLATVSANNAATLANLRAGEANTAAIAANNAATNANGIANSKEDKFTKKTGFNKDFGIVAGTVMEGDALKGRQVIARNPLAAELDIAQYVHWDSFLGKPVTNPYTLSDSGATYTRLAGTGVLRVQNTKMSASVVTDVFSIPTNGVGSVKFSVSTRFQPENRFTNILIGKDVNNYIEYRIGVPRIAVTIAGVTTVLFEGNASIYREDFSQVYHLDLYSDFSMSIIQGGVNAPYNNLNLLIESKTFPQARKTIDLSAYIATFKTKADIAFCGFSGASSGNPLSSWTIKSLAP